MTVRQANGDFARRFQTIRPADEFQSGQGFEVALRLRDYRLDPSLDKIKSWLPNDPFGLIVESIWCHALFDAAGLAVTEVELVPRVETETVETETVETETVETETVETKTAETELAETELKTEPSE